MSKHLHSGKKGSDGNWKLKFRSKRGYKNFAVNYPGTYTHDPNKSNESVEVDENTGPTRTAVNQEFKRVHGKQMDTGAATQHVEKKFKIKNVKVQRDNDGNRHVISFTEAIGDGKKKSKVSRRVDLAVSKMDRTFRNKKSNPIGSARAKQRVNSAAFGIQMGRDPEEMKQSPYHDKQDVRSAEKFLGIKEDMNKYDSYSEWQKAGFPTKKKNLKKKVAKIKLVSKGKGDDTVELRKLRSGAYVSKNESVERDEQSKKKMLKIKLKKGTEIGHEVRDHKGRLLDKGSSTV